MAHKYKVREKKKLSKQDKITRVVVWLMIISMLSGVAIAIVTSLLSYYGFFN